MPLRTKVLQKVSKCLSGYYVQGTILETALSILESI